MLGWMLKRGEHAQDDGDTTQIDQPDTPAPVFAARAFKSALFGTPAQPVEGPRNRRQEKRASQGPPERSAGTPTKPPGILLTPGTGVTRRKRVSFGNHVADAAMPAVGKAAADPTDVPSVRHAASKRGTTVEDSGASKDSKIGDPHAVVSARDSEGEWEEEDDDYCAHDVTVDLNEPHSQSGRYWKDEFEKYHKEAKAEMEKLLKYKQLAKSYARQKDAEAIQLAERLRDEQHKVTEMERTIAEKASQIVSKHRHSDTDPTESLSKLTQQTALAAQYRHRVKDLEHELDEVVRQKEGTVEGRGRRRRHMAASPTTQKTLMETQRELRRARTQLKELDSLRHEVSTLRARVKDAEAQASKHGKDGTAPSGDAKFRNLTAQLDQSREESRKKTEELRQLRADFEAFRKESETHEADTKAVLERAHSKISDLKKEVKALKSAGPDKCRPVSWHCQTESGQETECDRKEAAVAARGEREKSVRDSSRPTVRVQEHNRDEAKDAVDKASNALTERTNLGRPRWQPFVPRSPRNRAYLGDQPYTQSQPAIAAPALPAIDGGAVRTGNADGELDLLSAHFARVGGTGGNSHISSSTVGNTSKSSVLPPERRAAALARIEQRMAEKKRAPRRGGSDKENMRP